MLRTAARVPRKQRTIFSRPGRWAFVGLSIALLQALLLVVSAPARAEDAAPASPAQQPAAPAQPVTPAPPAPPAAPALHDRIDALLEGVAPGPQAVLASDADFLRRVYLDLNGTIPDSATARAFLDDASPDKRRALIERLLAAPRFARHMQHVFDVMWMERRADTNIPAAEWQEYLRQSFVDNKPLDQLAREILSADGSDAKLRPAARFYLDRNADANLITRDVGRLFFGRDLQCAQCHDHPLVADYAQAEYYGLMAFVARGSLFLDAKEKRSYYAETAEGDVNFKSVFTGNARDHVVPELPQGTPVIEPTLAAEERYVVAPAKEVRPIPKYSRRAQLAALATSGASEAFNRNLANRLWNQMFGRGLAHPLDMQHSANPPVQPELLDLLAKELVQTKFDLRAFLRELALTRAYQRSSEDPAEVVNVEVAALQPSVAAWEAEVQRLTAEQPALVAAGHQAAAAADSAYEKYAAATTARDAADKARAEAKKVSDEISKVLATALKEVETKTDVAKSLVEARDKAVAAAAKLPEDKALADATALFKTRADEVEAQRGAAAKIVADSQPKVQAASLKLAEVDQTLQGVATAFTQAQAALAAADAAVQANAEKLRATKGAAKELELRVADAKRALELQAMAATAAASQAAIQMANEQLASLKSQTAAAPEQLAQAEAALQAANEKATADRAAADQLWQAAVERASVRFMRAQLKPLSPEQLSWATMQAVGQVESQRVALQPQAAKDAEAIQPPEARPAHEQKLLEQRIDEKLRGNIPPFIALFGQQPGQPPSFQATVHQALFLANGGLLASWLNPADSNLTQRLTKLDDPQALADELYLSVLTRRPAPDEVAQVAAYWQAAQADRAAAAREMVWSLLTSAEFRFNH